MQLLKNDITWDDFSYSSALAWAVILLLGVLTGLDPNSTSNLPFSLPLAIIFGLAITVVSIFALVIFIKWWMKRRGCDSQGRMFRLVAATSALDLVAISLMIVGVPALFLLPIWLYVLWVATHALKQVCQVSTGYALAGVVLSAIPALLASAIVGAGLVFIFMATGLIPPPAM